jgi:hypothetical protein
MTTRPSIGHNNPPRDKYERDTLYLGIDEDGQRTLKWGWELNPWRAAPLPGRDKHGLMRPARDYALERAVARMNARPSRGTR